MPCAEFAVFGQVAPGLAHHPDGHAWQRFSTAGAEKKLLAIDGTSDWGHKVKLVQNNKSRSDLQVTTNTSARGPCAILAEVNVERLYLILTIVAYGLSLGSYVRLL